MSGPHQSEEDPQQYGPDGADIPVAPGNEVVPASDTAVSQAYSAPESEQFTGPYLPVDQRLYDYDAYSADTTAPPPRWPWVVGVVAIVAAVALVASVGILVARTESADTASTNATSTNPTSTLTTTRPPVQDEITTTAPPAPPVTTSEVPPPPPPPPPPPETVTVTSPPPVVPPPVQEPPPATSAPPPPPATTTPAGPRQVTYTVAGRKAPGDIISITYVDAAGRSRTLNNVYIPWAMTVTPISQSEVGSVQARSLFGLSRLNCRIAASDGQVLSASSADAPQISC